jgi:PAS domain S-box-containing protein
VSKTTGITSISWLLTLAALVGASLLWGLVMAHQHGREGAWKQFARDQLSQTRLIADQLESHFSHLEDSLNRLALVLDENNLDHLQTDLQLLAAGQPPAALTALFIRDDEGNILAAASPAGIVDSHLPLHLLNTPARKESGGRLLWIPQPAILISQRPPSEKRLELVALVLLPELIADITAGLEGDDDVLLMDATGQVLFHPDKGLRGLSYQNLMQQTPSEELRASYTAMAQGRSAADILVAGAIGPADRILSYAPFNLTGSRWSLGRMALARGMSAIDLTHQLTTALLVFAAGATSLLILFLLGGWRRARVLNELIARQEQRFRALETSVEEARTHSRQLLEFASDAMFFISPESGKIVNQNQVTCELLGYSAAEIADLPLTDLFSGHQKRRYQRLVNEVMEHGYGEEQDLIFRRKDGSSFTGALHARLGTLGHQRVVHGSLRDISPIKQIETELRRKNRDLALLNRIAHWAAATHHLQELLDGILEMVVEALDADSGGIFISRHEGNDLHFAARYNVPDAVYDELCHLQPGQGLAGLVASSGQPRSSVDLQNDRRRWSKTAGDCDWHGFQAVPLASGEKTVGVLFIACNKKKVFTREEVRLLAAIGKQVGTTVEGADLLEALRWQNRLTRASNRELESSRQRLKENLQRQEEATRTLERLESMKNNFLALASHELRTPLTYILSGTELLLDDQPNLPASQQKVLAAVHQGGERLQAIVDNLLEVARLEAQSIYLGRERIDLKLILDDLGQTFDQRLQRDEISLEISPPESGIELFGDPDHLGRALHRVLENAVKFTPPGGTIRVSAQPRDSREIKAMKPELEPFAPHFFNAPLAQRYLQLTVSDSGIGIDQEEQTRIFDKFYEVGDITAHHTSKTRFGGKGVGLGLTLVRGMIEAHGGMIWVTSKGTADGGGSQFHLLLPIGTAGTPAEARARYD